MPVRFSFRRIRVWLVTSIAAALVVASLVACASSGSSAAERRSLRDPPSRYVGIWSDSGATNDLLVVASTFGNVEDVTTLDLRTDPYARVKVSLACSWGLAEAGSPEQWIETWAALDTGAAMTLGVPPDEARRVHAWIPDQVEPRTMRLYAREGPARLGAAPGLELGKDRIVPVSVLVSDLFQRPGALIGLPTIRRYRGVVFDWRAGLAHFIRAEDVMNQVGGWEGWTRIPMLPALELKDVKAETPDRPWLAEMGEVERWLAEQGLPAGLIETPTWEDTEGRRVLPERNSGAWPVRLALPPIDPWLWVEARIAGRPFRAMIDTAAPGADAFFVFGSDLVEWRAPPRPVSGSTRVFDQPLLEGSLAGGMKIGPLRIDDVNARFVDEDLGILPLWRSEPVLVIGLDLLTRWPLWIDFDARTVSFWTSAEPMPDLQTSERSHHRASTEATARTTKEIHGDQSNE